MQNYVFTSESVTEGHPDKMCDQISDAVLDGLLTQDPQSRVACETLTTTGLVVLAGEITTHAQLDYQQKAREVIRDIGYTDPAFGFDWKTCGVMVAIGKQSPDIAQGVNEAQGLYQEQGAGDQGLMFGYACNETDTLMPLPIYLSHRLVARLSEVRRSGLLTWLGPDGKAQVSVRYEGSRPIAIDTVVLSTQHRDGITHQEIVDSITKTVITPVLPEALVNKDTRFLINPTGRFVIGGPHGDAGLTGRKIVVDTYGGMGRHGGGAFSGKDPSKVDRSAAYMARYVAKNIVAAQLAERCEVQIAYAIGYPEPVSVLVDTKSSSTVDEARIADAVREVFPLRPGQIVEHLKLLRPIYQQTAAFGHFGRELPDFTWEVTDKTAALRNLLG